MHRYDEGQKYSLVLHSIPPPGDQGEPWHIQARSQILKMFPMSAEDYDLMLMSGLPRPLVSGTLEEMREKADVLLRQGCGVQLLRED
jgi:hypothetical protein